MSMEMRVATSVRPQPSTGDATAAAHSRQAAPAPQDVVKQCHDHDYGFVPAAVLGATGPVAARAQAALRDPITHVRVLASDEMRGRNSPSPELDRAARYIAETAAALGLKGGNPANAENPFFQPFQLFTFAPRTDQADATGNFPRLFERGAFIDGLTPEDEALIRERLAEDGAVDSAPGEPIRSLLNPEGTVNNVVARLEGTGPNKDEVVLVMAHYDHVGARGDRIFNGADDNASGTAALLSIMPELVAAQRRGELNRSIVFLFTAAEEKGLLGAQYYVRNPVEGATLKDIEGVINVDMVGRWDDERLSVGANGNRRNFLDVLVDQANAKLDNPFDNVNRDLAAFERRQDGFAFGRAGEDVVFIFEGLSRATGGGSLNPDYHSPSDTLENMLAENGGAKLRKVRDFLEHLVKLTSNRPKE